MGIYEARLKLHPEEETMMHIRVVSEDGTHRVLPDPSPGGGSPRGRRGPRGSPAVAAEPEAVAEAPEAAEAAPAEEPGPQKSRRRIAGGLNRFNPCSASI